MFAVFSRYFEQATVFRPETISNLIYYKLRLVHEKYQEYLENRTLLPIFSLRFDDVSHRDLVRESVTFIHYIPDNP